MKYMINILLVILLVVGFATFIFIIIQINKILPMNKDFWDSLILLSLKTDNSNSKILLSLLPPFGILLSALIASLSIMRTINNTNELEKNKNQNDISKYYVEKCTEGFKIVYDLLKDQNNNPSTWIEAARILKYTLELSDSIKENSPYKKIYEIKVFQYRHLLLKTLSDENGNSFKTSFFFGIKDWKEKKVQEADEIALENSRSSSEVLKYEVIDSPKGAFINESAIKIIFDFISYEDDFNDPLKNEAIKDLEQWKYSGYIANIKEGAYNYLKYKKDLREKS